MIQNVFCKLDVIIGFLMLFHSAYSAAQHRLYLRITQQEFTSLPVDILVQGIVCLFVVMNGILGLAGDFKEIRATVDLETKSWETQRNISSFYVFNHRGKSFNTHYMHAMGASKTILDEVE